MKKIELPTMEQVQRAVEESRKVRERRAKKLALQEARKSLETYWNESISTSVLSDVKNGNVKIIYC